LYIFFLLLNDLQERPSLLDFTFLTSTFSRERERERKKKVEKKNEKKMKKKNLEKQI
jgi:hypothetical protein